MENPEFPEFQVHHTKFGLSLLSASLFSDPGKHGQEYRPGTTIDTKCNRKKGLGLGLEKPEQT